ANPYPSPTPPVTLPHVFSSQYYRAHRHLHSFPTRRSSDLHRLPESINALARGPRRNDRALARRRSHLAGPSQQRCQVRPASRERSEEHTSELQSRENLVCRLLLEKKKSAPETVHHAQAHAR